MYDVIVVGGGPVGSYAAYKLAGAGYKVVVLEQKPGIGQKASCTGIISQECADSFAIDGDIILLGVRSARLVSPSGDQLRLWREETQACILDRVAFDIAMARRAQGRGVEYVMDSPVSNIAIDGDKVGVRVSRDGVGLDFESRVVVVASGFGSRLSERLGLGRVGDFVVGAQAEVGTVGLDEVEVYFGRDIAPGFFAWLVPTSPRTARVGLLSRKSPGLYLKNLMASLRARGKIVSDKVEPSYGGIPLKPLPRTYGERLVVVGDAAGQVKPTSGGGIYYGLLCADIAADTLHQALEQGDVSARRLARYEQGWRKKLGQELKIDYWARKLFERLSDKQIDGVFEIIKASGIDEALLKAEDLSFDWHGNAVLRLMGHRVVSRAVDVVRVPFRTRGG